MGCNYIKWANFEELPALAESEKIERGPGYWENCLIRKSAKKILTKILNYPSFHLF